MGYAGYVPAKIAQFEFTPLEQARRWPPLHPARFRASPRAAAAHSAPRARSGAPRSAAHRSLLRPMRRALRGLILISAQALKSVPAGGAASLEVLKKARATCSSPLPSQRTASGTPERRGCAAGCAFGREAHENEWSPRVPLGTPLRTRASAETARPCRAAFARSACTPAGWLIIVRCAAR
jgi:hypothetical protein